MTQHCIRALKIRARSIRTTIWLQCTLRDQQGAGHEYSTDGFRSAQTSRADAAGSALGADGFGSASTLRADAARTPHEDRFEPRSRTSGNACSSARSSGTGAFHRACAGGIETGVRRRRWWRPVRMAQEAVRRLIERRGQSSGAAGTADIASPTFRPCRGNGVRATQRSRRRSARDACARGRRFRLRVRRVRSRPRSWRPGHPQRNRQTNPPAHTWSRRTADR